jgi:hypothetical protein
VSENHKAEIEGMVARAMEELGELLQKTDAMIQDDSVLIAEKIAAVFALYRKGIQFYNSLEGAVAREELSQNNENRHWRSFVAESSYDALDSLVRFLTQVWETAESIGLSTRDLRPSPTAFAGLQRLAMEEYPDLAHRLRLRFLELELPTVGFDKAIPRSPRSGADTASLEFEADGLRKAMGLKSEHAVEIAKGLVKQGPDGYSAPASASAAESVLKAGPRPPEAWWQRQWTLLKEAPVPVLLGILGALVVAGLVRVGWWPSEPTPVVEPTGSAATVEAPAPLVTPMPPPVEPEASASTAEIPTLTKP